jgi:hypothetical protein
MHASGYRFGVAIEIAIEVRGWPIEGELRKEAISDPIDSLV